MKKQHFLRALLLPLAVVLLVGLCQSSVSPYGAAAQISTYDGLETTPAWNGHRMYQPESIAWGDVDNDGDLDLALGGGWDGTYVFLNAGDMLQSGPTWRGLAGRSVAWGDVNNDGYLDLLVGGTNLLYLNDQGTLRANPVWDADDGSYAAWGDVDGDSDLDLAVISDTDSYLYTNLAGVLELTPAWTGAGGTSVAWGDVDSDGDLDLLVVGSPTQLYLNQQGRLQNVSAWSVDTGISAAWGDVDNDGDLDLLVTGFPSQLYLNYNGVLQSSAVWLSGNALQAAWGDVDSDGDLDLMVTGLQNALFLNDAGVLQTNPAWATGNGHDVAWGDMDGDGDLDVASSDRVYRNLYGTLRSSAWTPTNPLANGLAWGDVDSDGDLDLALGDADWMSLVYANLRGRLEDNPIWQSGATNYTDEVAWGDMDGDGALDLVAIGYERDNGFAAGVYRNVAGVLEQDVSWQSQWAEMVSGIAWGDVDGDGDLDMAVGHENIVGDAIHPNRTANELYRNENGMLAAEPFWKSDEMRTSSLAWGDVDNDGDLDLAVGNILQPSRLFVNNSGMLQLSSWSPLGTSVQSLAWGDMDGDGNLDLALGSSDSFNRVYRNLGGRLQDTPVWQSVYKSSTQSLIWGDADGDGDLDLAVGNRNAPTQLYLNVDGMLDLLPVWTAESGPKTMQLAWGDVDQDGRLDLVVSDYQVPSRLYLNIGPADRHYPADPPPGLAISMHTQPAQTFSGQAAALLAPADGYALSWIRDQATLPITYSLLDPGSTARMNVRAEYSLNGGGAWLPAQAYTGTLTDGLSTGPSGGVISYTANIPTPVNLPRGGANETVITFTLPMTRNYIVADLDVWLTIEHAYTAELAVWLRSPAGTQIELFSQVGANGDNFTHTWLDDEAEIAISDGSAPFSAHYRPAQALSAFDGQDSRGAWQLVVRDLTAGNNGRLLGWGLRLDTGNTHTFTWDVWNSGFFGQSDNVVLRLVAQPGVWSGRNGLPGPYQRRPYLSSATFPLRVRGSQVRVVNAAGAGLPGARVYRLLPGQVQGTPLADAEGTVYQSNSLGHLPGRGELYAGDRLAALWPAVISDTYTLYHTNAIPSLSGVDAYTVTHGGVQTLVVSDEHPLLAFNLDISLEWDARNDGNFNNELQDALRKTAAVLYDISDGQITIGNVRVFHNRQNWLASDIVIYAQTGIRPRASMGGVSDRLIDDVYVDQRIIKNAYGPGQIRIGPNWDPFGTSVAELTVDWQRALAHELAHYLLYLPDNYLGINEHGQPINTDCRGSFMTSTYDDDYSELLIAADWQDDCLNTVAQKTTGRVDWQTVLKFYNMLKMPVSDNPGPANLPLDITQVTFVASGTAMSIAPRIYDVRNAQAEGRLISLSSAQAFLFQEQGTADLSDDRLLPWGGTLGGGDRFKGRGANPGDRLCLFGAPDQASGRSYAGCIAELSALDASLAVSSSVAWQPQIVATSVSSVTLQVSVTLPAPQAGLQVQFYPAYGAPGEAFISPWQVMNQVGSSSQYTATFNLAAPAFEGWLRLWVDGQTPQYEVLSQIFLSPPWGGNRGGVGGMADQRAWGANQRQLGAPVASGDGQVTIFNVQDIFSDTGTVSLQALNALPDLPAWLTPVGQGYRFSAEQVFPRFITFDYLQREVPAGYEHSLTVYYQPEGQTGWQRLDTNMDQHANQATAIMPANAANGRGIYALMATLEMPALQPGWNLFSYPIPGSRSLVEGLASIGDAYSSIYHYSPLTQTWRLYDRGVVVSHPGFSGLVNDLTVLEFGQSYWLHATEVITPYLGVKPVAARGSADDAPGLPPATLYGPLLEAPDFHPAAGMLVQAWLGNTLCGQSQVLIFNDQPAYRLQVGCAQAWAGEAGAPTLILMLDGEFVGHIVWDNTRAAYLPLTALEKVYLPLASIP